MADRAKAAARSAGAVRLDDAAADLFLGSSCVGCAAAGRMLCRACAGALAGLRPVAMVGRCGPVWACGGYGGALQALVIGHKERRQWSLADPLGSLLATAASGALGAPGMRAAGEWPTVLVPVPSRPASVRARGHDPTWAMTRRAAALLRAEGTDAVAVRLLAHRDGVRDQAGLGVEERAANLAGSMWVPSRRLAALARRAPRVRVLVCDDVMTTGATLAEARRALTAVGLEPTASAVVAAVAGPGTTVVTAI